MCRLIFTTEARVPVNEARVPVNLKQRYTSMLYNSSLELKQR